MTGSSCVLDRDLDRLADILSHTDSLLALTKGKDLATFRADKTLQWASERLLEIIGEAAGALSAEAREEIDHDWAGLRALRNVLAHQYGAVDPARIHAILRDRIPRLRKDLEPYVDLL